MLELDNTSALMGGLRGEGLGLDLCDTAFTANQACHIHALPTVHAQQYLTALVNGLLPDVLFVRRMWEP